MYLIIDELHIDVHTFAWLFQAELLYICCLKFYNFLKFIYINIIYVGI
jgi:hypothetical protein